MWQRLTALLLRINGTSSTTPPTWSDLDSVLILIPTLYAWVFVRVPYTTNQMPMQEMISEMLQDIYPDMSTVEADAQALDIFYDSESYLEMLDDLLSNDYE